MALVGEPGVRGDEAELRRAACLEQLGRHQDAKKAYAQYLERENPAAAGRARERLQSLENQEPRGSAPP